MSNNLRTRNGMPFNFVNGLKVRGMDIESLIPGIEGIPEAGSKYQFAGNGSNKAFTLPVSPYNKDAVDVYVKQLYVHPDDYTLVGDTITLTEAPPALVAGETYNVVIKVNLTTLNGYVNASRVSFEGENLDDILEKSKPLANYSNLRAYAGAATQVRITDSGIAGFFYYDATDTTSTDNGGTIIVSSNGKRWKRVYSERIRISWFGLGESAFILAILSVGSAERNLIIDTNVTISTAFTVPQNVTLTVERGSVITISADITLTVLGRIDSGNYVIFSGAGILDLNAGSAFFNIAWFSGTYFNNKWDFISRGLVSLRPFTVFVPKPERGMQGTVEVSSNLIYWAINAPITFPDKANGCQWVSDTDARIIAVTPIDAMVEFSTDSKVEDVTFTSGIWLEGDSKAAYGMKFHGGSRIRSNGMIQISGCLYNMYFDNIGGSNDKINLNSVYLSRWGEAAIWVEGSASAMVACYFPEIIMEEPLNNLKNCIVVRGQTRGLRFGRIHYIHFTDGKVADCVVLVQSTATGYSSGLKIDEVYTSSLVNTLIKIENNGGTQRAVYTSIGKLGGLSTTVPAVLNYDTYTSVQEYTGLDIAYGVNCQEPIPNTDVITRVYDFSKSGGAIGTYNLGGSLPKGSTGFRAWYRVVTGFSSSGTATLRLGITGTLAGIKEITAFNDAVWSVGLHDGIPDGTALKALPEVINSDTFISFVIANAALNSGKVIVYLQIVR